MAATKKIAKKSVKKIASKKTVTKVETPKPLVKKSIPTLPKFSPLYLAAFFFACVALLNMLQGDSRKVPVWIVLAIVFYFIGRRISR
jgi:hypothetical protein